MMGVGGWGKSFPVLCRKCHSRPKRLSPTRVCNIKISIVLINRKGRGGGGHFKIQGQEGMGDKKKGTLLSSVSFSCPFLPPRKRGGDTERQEGKKERPSSFALVGAALLLLLLLFVSLTDRRRIMKNVRRFMSGGERGG